MRRLIYIFTVAGVAAGLVTVVAKATPTHYWSQSFGDGSFDYGTAVAVDASGNVFLGGYFQGSVDFGGATHFTVDYNDMFLAKFDATGVYQWSLTFGGVGFDWLRDLATDSSGNVILAGTFPNSVDFGGGTLVSAGGDDVALAKFDADGNHLWSQSFGGSGDDAMTGVTIDSADNVIVAGYFDGNVDFGGGALTNVGGWDIFIAKYDANGSHIWSQSFGNDGGDLGWDVAVGANDNVHVTGSFQGSVDFGGGPIAASVGDDFFVAKYDANGTHVWSHGYGGVSGESGFSIDVDVSGNIAVTGEFADTVSFGGPALASVGDYDILVAKYDANGAHVWSHGFGDVNYERGNSVRFDDRGTVLIAGRFDGSNLDFGGGALPYAGNVDMYLASFDASGAHRWSQAWGGTSTNYDWVQMIDTGTDGDIFAAGVMSDGLDFGGGSLSGYGLRDIFLVKFNDKPGPIITEISDIGNDEGRQVRILWDRAGRDQSGSPDEVLSYVVYRRDDAPPSLVTSANDRANDPEMAMMLPGWIYVGTAPAHEEESYGIVVPTIGDSTEASGQYYSVFYVRAATSMPAVYFDSPPDSGYSLDNLAPGVPLNLIYEAGALTWEAPGARDVDHYTIYGADTGDFASATVVDYANTPGKDVTASLYSYYFVTATDRSGNEGEPAVIQVSQGGGETPRNYILSLTSHPNPFNPSTTLEYTVPSPGVVTVAIYDARGARVATLVNGAHEAGAYSVEWMGRTKWGSAAPSGVYFVRIEHGGSVRTKKTVLLK